MQYAISFLEGLITFISPCLLPMLPIYATYFAGGGERNPAKTLRNALGFVLGFTLVFTAMGALAGTLGSFLTAHQTALNIVSGLIVIVFGFFFATVSSRMVGLIGSSNNPVSGMAIATLLISTMLLKATGTVGIEGMTAAIVIGGIICVIAAIAGDTSQDLKTGFLVGATPKKQQIGELIGVAVSSVAIGAILYLLSMAWGGYGSNDLPAPQAMLMKMIVEGVMGGNLPWNMVFAGVFIAIVVEVLGIPVLPFAIGLYLPIYLSVPMMLGGALRWFLEKRKYASEKDKNDTVQSGVLYSSGLIAGEGIVGILLAVLAIIPAGLNAKGETLYVSDKINFGEVFSIGNIGGLICFAVILFTIYLFATKDSKKK